MLAVIIAILSLWVLSYLFFFKKKYVAMWSEKSTNRNWYGKLLEEDDFIQHCNFIGAMTLGFSFFVIIKVVVPHFM